MQLLQTVAEEGVLNKKVVTLMENLIVTINEATITNMHEVHSNQGYGLDIFIRAENDAGTVYLQIVLYDDRARAAYRSVQVGNCIKLSGQLKVKNYSKKDGTTGLSLVVENPSPINIIPHRNNESQRQDQPSSSDTPTNTSSNTPTNTLLDDDDQPW